MNKNTMILVINAGSSSIKFKVYQADNYEVLASGQCEKISNPIGIFSFKSKEVHKEENISIPNHETGVNLILNALKKHNIIPDFKLIKGIGHRIVMGGRKYLNSAIVNEKVIKDLVDYYPLVPLHNPPEVDTIKIFQSLLPNTPNVVVFDTSFHATIPDYNQYALSDDIVKKYQIYRYGFHGTSYRYITEQMQKILNKKDVNLVVCHLGNGASVCAIEHSKSIDTSMGLTPLEGLVMGTRCGDIDPSVVTYLIRQGFKPNEVDDLLNKKSGLKGMCGTNDFREINANIDKGDMKALKAAIMFTKRVAKYIVQYINELQNNVDGIVFTGGIGENDLQTIQNILNNLHVINTSLDYKALKEKLVDYKLISSKFATCPIYIIRTNEELMIAHDVNSLVN